MPYHKDGWRLCPSRERVAAPPIRLRIYFDLNDNFYHPAMRSIAEVGLTMKTLEAKSVPVPSMIRSLRRPNMATRIHAPFGSPGEVSAQVGLGVIAGRARETGEVCHRPGLIRDLQLPRVGDSGSGCWCRQELHTQGCCGSPQSAIGRPQDER
jgi:hypothetical protein